MKRATIFLALIPAIAIIIGCSGGHKKDTKKANLKATSIPVVTAIAHLGDMDESIDVSGNLKALKTVQLSAKAAGRVVSVPYREDDFVPAGAVVIKQDTTNLADNVRQAEAALVEQKAQLSKSITNASVGDTTIDSDIAAKQAALDAAKARLQTTRVPLRKENLAMKESAVVSAKAGYDNAKTELTRAQSLFSEGAASQQSLDAAQRTFDQASAAYDSAREDYSASKTGRKEDINAAEKDVTRADEDLKQAIARRENKKLNREDIKEAQAGVASAEAALTSAKQALSDAFIRSPIAGRVSLRNTEPGNQAATGTTLMEIVALDTVYFEATVSEMDLHSIKLGQPVSVTVDALPDRVFMGRVIKMLPTADPSSRQFTVWVSVPNGKGELKPGMFARGKIQIARHANVVIVSKDAVVENGDKNSVFKVVDGKAQQVQVTTGFSTRSEVEVDSGIHAGDVVVTVGQDKLSDGVRVSGAGQ